MNDTPKPPDPDVHDEDEDARTLAELYEKHHSSLLRQLRRTLPVDAAWDALHNLFCACLQGWRAGKIDKPLHYLRRALTYKRADWVRDRQQRRALQAQLKRAGVLRDTTAPPAETCASLTHDLEALLHALGKDHPEQARALRLVRLEELSMGQAAERMGKNRHQVTRLIQRALLALNTAREEGERR